MGTMYGIIEQLCSERGIKPGKLCSELGISRGILSDLKAGRTKKLSSENITKISSYFGISADYLLGHVSEPYFYLDNDRILREINSYSNEDSIPSKPDVLDEVDVAFYGEYKQLSEDDKDTIRDMVRVMRERRAKKQE